MLERGELPGYRIVALSRVSDSDSWASLDRQDGYLHEEYQTLDETYNAELVKKYSLGESASTMDRESLEEILEMAKNDEFDILMVWAIHRLTRADPWETFDYLLKLREQGIIIYSDKDGYYDWDDPDDADLMADRVTTAREWRNEIQRGTIENNQKHLQEGRWPYGKTPYGTKKEENQDDDDDHELVIKEGYNWVYQEIFESHIEGKEEDEISEYIESRIEEKDIDIEPPTEHQVENILENEIFVGRLVLQRTNEVVREKEDLKVVDPETFTKVQEIRQGDESKQSHDLGPHHFPDFIYQLILRYGQEYVVENISAIRWCCPKCGSVDINISDTTIEHWNITLPKIYCKNSHCEYNGPVIRLKELNEIDSTLPFVCPSCKRTDKFDSQSVSVEDEEKELYKYTCRHCDEFIITDKHPNTVRRALNNPENAINLKNSTGASNEQNISKQPDNNTDSVENQSASDGQTKLDSFDST